MESHVIQVRESLISAQHNYLVNDMLAPGFLIGDPNQKTHGFYFLADVLLPGENTPRIFARLMDNEGKPLAEIRWNRISENTGKCLYRSVPRGFWIGRNEDEPLLEVITQSFSNGYLTHIKATLFDENGLLRVESHGKSIHLLDASDFVLKSPFPYKP